MTQFGITRMNVSDTSESRYRVQLAQTADEVLQSQRLRRAVFVDELGAKAEVNAEGGEFDHYDTFCRHLLVTDQQSGALVASTRLLTGEQAKLAGGFYSANEFDLSMLRHLHGEVVEIGRTCVHAEHRNGATIGVLWQGLAAFMERYHITHLFGSASIPMFDGGIAAHSIMQDLRANHLADEPLRVAPRRPLPAIDPLHVLGKTRMPPLLKAYMRLGAQICGEPCWDPDFNCADIFILLDVSKLQARYHRHFVQRNMQESTSDTLNPHALFSNDEHSSSQRLA